MARQKRLNVFSDSKVQLRILALFIFWAVVLVLCLTALFFLSYVQVTESALGISVDPMLTRSMMIQLSRTLAINFGVAILLFISLMGIHVVIFSHRMTGPITKLSNILKKSVETGQWPTTVKFRKRDSYKDLATAVNEFVESARAGRLK